MQEAPQAQQPTGPFDLGETPLHLGTGAGAGPVVALPGFGFDPASFEAYIAAHCAQGSPGRLIMIETTPESWRSWECHTQGDEIVIVLEGRGEMIQEIEGEQRRTPVGPGVAIVNPQGVWHTADVEAPLRAIYVTPCPGTRHRPR